MSTRKLLQTLLAGTLLLTACMPATMSTDSAMHDNTMESTTMADDGMADDGMADDGMADDGMADDSMADQKDDTMMHDSQMMTDTHAMTDTMTDGMMHDSEMMTDTHAMTDTMSGAESGAMMHDDTMMELPAWQTMSLTDAHTGATFTLADFTGKHLFVETMATWCSNCRQQLGNVRDAVAKANSEEVAFIAISVETDLAAETLAQYAENNDFGWTFAVATPEMVRALAETFGPTIANPPATPHFWIHPDGSHSDLVTGFERGDAILAQLGN